MYPALVFPPTVPYDLSYETSTSVQPTQILGGRKRLQSKSTNNDLSDNDDDDLFDEDDMDVAGGDNDIDISVKRIKESFASDQLEEGNL